MGMVRQSLAMFVISMILLTSNCLAVFDNNRFISAAKNGDTEIIQEMSADAEVSQADKDVALQWAVYSGRLAIVQFLLGMEINGRQLPADQIANIHANDNYALRLAESSASLGEDYQKILQFLRQHQAAVDASHQIWH